MPCFLKRLLMTKFPLDELLSKMISPPGNLLAIVLKNFETSSLSKYAESSRNHEKTISIVEAYVFHPTEIED